MKLTWLWIIIVGAVLFFGSDVTLQSTGNPNFVPTVIMLGAFIIPVAFVAYSGMLTVAVVSLGVLIMLYREARRTPVSTIA